jgi:DNA polymerase elongation subunit (family B)
MNFYTNVQSLGSQILYRGVRGGKRIKMRIDYEPSLYLPSKGLQTAYKNLQGDYLTRKKFDTMREARDFIKRYQDIPGAPTIYGQTRFEYQFIGDQHQGAIQFDPSLVQVDFLDIEVGSENGFPDPYEANEPITAIGLKTLGGHMIVWGCGDYDNKLDKNNEGVRVTYIKCKDEWTLCKRFITHWQQFCPDILTGWNTEFFDIPYLVNRFRKVLGEDETKKLSPWNFITERKVNKNGKILISYTLVGLAHLDYIELYKWYAPNGKSQENYRLDTIAEAEIGENKLSYEEFDNLHSLYRLDHQKFIEYNIKDVVLVERINDKLKLLEMAITLAYDTKSNMEDVFAQTRMWDALTYCYLHDRGIIVPPRIVQDKDDRFEGAYVKEVQTGAHDWVASFDLDSLYPHLMMQYNISPETLIEPEDYTEEMRSVLAQGVTVEKMLSKQIDTSSLEGQGVTMTPNGQFFRTDKQGFLPEMLEAMYEDRKTFKKMMLSAKQELENEPDESKHHEIENRIAMYNNIQLAKKVGLNSAYGALGSQYFRFYDLRMALGVTSAGKLSIRWIENKINAYMNKLIGGEETDYVIASDTDSIYLRMAELVMKVYGAEKTVSLPKVKIIDFMDRVCEERMKPYIDKSYQELAEYVHAYKQKMRMKREGLSDRGIWTAKKRYILNVYDNEGVRYREPDLKVMGLEMIKSSTPSAVRVKMKELVKVMIHGNEKDVQNFVADFRKEFSALPPEDISFPRGCNGIANYMDQLTLFKKGTPIHVRGTILYNHYLKEKNLTKKYPLIQEGEKIKFAYLKMPNPFKNDVISFPGRLPTEFDIHDYIDYNTQFEKTFLEPIRVIVEQVGWKVEHTDSIEDFFT